MKPLASILVLLIYWTPALPLPSQDVAEEKIVTTRSGLKLADVRIGGGAPVNQGMLVILDYRCEAPVWCNPLFAS